MFNQVFKNSTSILLTNLRSYIKIEYVLFLLLLFSFQFAEASSLSEWWAKISSGITENTTIATIFANFDAAGRSLIALLKLLALIMGAIICLFALNQFIRVSDGKERTSSAMYMLFAGFLLFSFVPSLDMFSATLGMGKTAIGLSPACEYGFTGCKTANMTLSQYSMAALTGVITLIRFVGYTAAVKGILHLLEVGKNGGMAAAFKALGHFAGGVLCVNVVAVALILANQVAPNSAFTNFIKNSDKLSVVIKT
jgi:membrane protein